jgi:hypothetical protein
MGYDAGTAIDSTTVLPHGAGGARGSRFRQLLYGAAESTALGDSVSPRTKGSAMGGPDEGPAGARLRYLTRRFEVLTPRVSGRSLRSRQTEDVTTILAVRPNGRVAVGDPSPWPKLVPELRRQVTS